LTDDLSPTPEPEPSYLLKQAARLTGQPINALRRRCAEGSLSAWKEPLFEGDPNPAWRIRHSALVAVGLLSEGPPPPPPGETERPSSVAEEVHLLAPPAREEAHLQTPSRAVEPDRLSLIELGREVLDIARSELVPGLKASGQVALLERMLSEKEEEVALLRGRLQETAAERDRLAAELAAERTRAPRFGEWFWGKRGSR